MTRRRHAVAAGLAAALVLAASAAAARPTGPVLPSPPVGGGAGPQVAPAPAPLDTVVAPVGLPLAPGSLRSLAVRPDSVAFGGLAWIVAEAAPGTAAGDTLTLPGWLEPAPNAGQPPGPAPAAGAVVVPVRVYGVAPFRLEADGRRSDVVTVHGGGTDGALTAPVRDPLAPGWNALFIAAVLAAAAAVAVLTWWLLRRRRPPRARPEDRPVPGPAWPALALGLDEALARLAAEGDARSCLDRLAALTRAYAAERFGIAGREMTGAEVAAACLRLGYGSDVGRAFARLLEGLDARRFDPRPADAARCREQAAALVRAVGAVRIAEPAPGGPAVPAAAVAAWQRLSADAAAGGEAA